MLQTTLLHANMLSRRNLISQIRIIPSLQHQCHCHTSEEKGTKPSKVKSYVQQSFMKFIERYIGKNVEKFEKRFQKLSPETFRFYLLFKTGMKSFSGDSLQWLEVKKGEMTGVKLETFNPQQLDNFRQIPSDMLRISPVLAVSLLPLGYLVLIPVFMYPNTLVKNMMTRHFWTAEQKLRFNEDHLRLRMLYYPKILLFLMKESRRIEDETLKVKFQNILEKIQRGKQPKVKDILEVKALFEGKPFGFDSLYKKHRLYMQWHMSHTWKFGGRKRLMYDSALLLNCTNIAMKRVGLDTMSMEELQLACIHRGLLSSDLYAGDLKEYLRSFIKISEGVDESSISLLLHSHVLLSYAHPNNFKHLVSIGDDV